MFSRILGSTAILAGLSMAAPVAAETTLHILHINDLHSRIQPINRFDSTCPAEDDAAGECFGGVARVATAINTLRDELTAAGENVIVLDAGDQFQGSLMYTTYKGDVEAEFMQAIGFDAMAVGNHEFDDGPDNFIRFLQVVDFPVLSGNLDLSQNDALDAEVEDTIVLDVNGVQVGLVSALATDTAETSSPGPTVIFQAEIDAIQNDVDALTEQGVDIIIALTHVGLPVGHADRRSRHRPRRDRRRPFAHLPVGERSRPGRGLPDLDLEPRWRDGSDRAGLCLLEIPRPSRGHLR
jgi:5'-nucleotidase/UDP-sugar diphosphatase